MTWDVFFQFPAIRASNAGVNFYRIYGFGM